MSTLLYVDPSMGFAGQETIVTLGIKNFDSAAALDSLHVFHNLCIAVQASSLIESSTDSTVTEISLNLTSNVAGSFLTSVATCGDPVTCSNKNVSFSFEVVDPTAIR